MFPKCSMVLAVSCAMTLTIQGVTAAAEMPLNLLFFGNSYSQGGVQWRVQDLAVADGHPMPTVLADTMGGMDLAYHIGEVANNPQNNVSNSIIAGKTWDYVIIQGLSTEATHYDGNAIPFRQDALALYKAVRDHSSGYGVGAKAILMETWARAVGSTMYPNTFANPASMQAEITTNYYLACNDINASEGAGSARVAPVGDSFGEFGWDPWLYNSDLHHQNTIGNLLQSMIVYRTIYGENVGDITYSEWQAADRTDAAYKVDAATWNALVAVADSMVIAVPEPATLTLGVVTLALLCSRRRERA